MQIRTPHQLAQAEPATVRQERTISKQMVQELLMSAVQKFKDSSVQAVSDPTKMEAAYDAILFSALAVFAAQGYRISSNQGHHRLALEGLAGSLGLGESVLDEMQLMLDLRNSKYTGFLTVKPADLKLGLGLAERILSETSGWLEQNHPDLLKN